ncbi:hypothetical protein IMY05_001G0299400 [Salix suchowensis]|nr:hypothetical protein IMY05_001G0299400 [Salix suchowensis]
MLPSTSTNTYDFTKILSKKKTKASITIPELHSEIKTLKTELQSLKQAQQKDSAILQNLLSKIENQSDPDSDQEATDPDLYALHDTNLEQIDTVFLDVLSQISSKKYIIKLSIVFSDDYKLDIIALFDTGADLNCIREGVVPKRLLQQTNEKLSDVNSSKLDIAGKTQASMLNNGISVTKFFVVTKDINHTIILAPDITISTEPNILNEHKYKKHFHSKQPEQTYYKKPYKKFTKHSKPFQPKTKNFGHMSCFCKIITKLHELQIDEDTIYLIQNLYIEALDTDPSSLGTSEEELQVDELVTLSATSDTSTKSKKLNVLTQDQEFILEAIKGLDDPQLQKITDKTQLQRFLDSLNYALDFYPNLIRIAKPLHDRLRKNLIKEQDQTIPLLHLVVPLAPKIVKTNAS